MKTLKEFLAESTQVVKEAVHPSSVQGIIDDEISIFNKATSISLENQIPDTSRIPIENPSHWFSIPDVISCFVDMEGSTKLSATTHDKSTAKFYRLFTGTAVKIFHHFDADYIDVRGDGVFALFSKGREHTALAATVSFKTFVFNHFSRLVKTKSDLEIGGHFGIDQKTVLVRKVGLKRYNGRSDRQNEVWAGKPINMSAKLASISTGNSLLVSDRFFQRLTAEAAKLSCGCNSQDSQPKPLWTKLDLDDDRFDFSVAHELKSNWCPIHGDNFCRKLVSADS